MKADIAASGGKCLAAIVDLTDAAAIANFVRRAEQELGLVDILVNNFVLVGPLLFLASADSISSRAKPSSSMVTPSCIERPGSFFRPLCLHQGG